MRGGRKVLSGANVIDILTGFGFAVIGGKKHVKLRRGGPDGDQTLIVPNHSPSQKARDALFFRRRRVTFPKATSTHISTTTRRCSQSA